ncbi:hypothetical protein MLD38_010439 [Melastoma candidum]|uniref:Uncharacterized protein n=1 Tax=Melastoma candidum TaxID=119954 RepID=A0ACB9R0E7_9MYRT|nr:hypothetical protein MLD38_010439 [Melastoma candidum]
MTSLAHDKHMDPNPGFPQHCRPRGFAASSSASSANDGNSSAVGKRGREKEKERTKLRERHRRAITSKMLAGLRQYGNFPLPARADMNDVIAALARDAGWTVEADGTTYRHSHPQTQSQPMPRLQPVAHSGSFRDSPRELKSSHELKTALEDQTLVTMVVRSDEILSPLSLDSVVVPERDSKNGKYSVAVGLALLSGVWTLNSLSKMLIPGIENMFPEKKVLFPVYVKLDNGFIDNYCQLINQEDVRQEMNCIKSLNADGVFINCWWGIVESWCPQKYLWSGYRELFTIVREFKLKIQLFLDICRVLLFWHFMGLENMVQVMSLSLCRNGFLEIGKENPDIFFTAHEGRRYTECLSWGVDKARVLEGRTGVEVYFDVMRSFRQSSMIFLLKWGMEISGIGEFQCQDKYFQLSLAKAAKIRGHAFWARAPDNAGNYNSRPHETGFFCEGGDYDSYYGRFFLNWYSQCLIDHADCILSLACLTFEGHQHCGEGSCCLLVVQDQQPRLRAYCRILQLLKPGWDERGIIDPEGLFWQVVNCARIWDWRHLRLLSGLWAFQSWTSSSNLCMVV